MNFSSRRLPTFLANATTFGVRSVALSSAAVSAGVTYTAIVGYD